MKRGSLPVRAFTLLGMLLAVSLLASPAVAAPDTVLTIKNMEISIWPEYDDPRVLVAYRGGFIDSSVFPSRVAFPAPLGSEMTMVCALRPPNNEHLCQLYDTAIGTDALSVSYNLPIPTYYLEYYWDGIRTGNDKSFSFEYTSPYAIDTLEFEVQQPLRATNFQLSQPYASTDTDSLGMRYYRYAFNNIAPGQVVTIAASYTKADDKPSVTKKTGSAAASGSSSAGATNGILIIGVITMAVIAGLVLFRRKPAIVPTRAALSRKAARIEARRAGIHNFDPQSYRKQHQYGQGRQPAVRTPSLPKPDRAAATFFCTQCGTMLASGSVFCHMCGARAVGSD